MEKKYPFVKYSKWPTDEEDKWVYAGHTFGMHLMKNVRDEAMSKIPEDASPEEIKIAKESIFNTLYAMMQMFDGFFTNGIDKNHEANYMLISRIIENEEKVVEHFEIAPDGDGLCMAIHGWWEDDFDLV